MVSVSVRYLFYQPMGEKIKTWTLRFPAKENPDTGKALFDWKVLGHDVFSPGRSFNQPKATRVCIRSINQSNRSISVRLLFLFCSRFFISRSWENRSNLGHAGLSSSLSGLFRKSSPQSSHRSKSPPHRLPAALYDISRKMTIVSSGFLRKFDINNN